YQPVPLAQHIRNANLQHAARLPWQLLCSRELAIAAGGMQISLQVKLVDQRIEPAGFAVQYALRIARTFTCQGLVTLQQHDLPAALRKRTCGTAAGQTAAKDAYC